jgi:hypothetical protein
LPDVARRARRCLAARGTAGSVQSGGTAPAGAHQTETRCGEELNVAKARKTTRKGGARKKSAGKKKASARGRKAAARKPARKTARKAARKAAPRKSAKKAAKKAARKTGRKAAPKAAARKTRRPSRPRAAAPSAAPAEPLPVSVFDTVTDEPVQAELIGPGGDEES